MDAFFRRIEREAPHLEPIVHYIKGECRTPQEAKNRLSGMIQSWEQKIKNMSREKSDNPKRQELNEAYLQQFRQEHQGFLELLQRLQERFPDA